MAFSDSKPHYALLNGLCGVACTHRVATAVNSRDSWHIAHCLKLSNVV